jgi:flagellar basal body-associated protein FliL
MSKQTKIIIVALGIVVILGAVYVTFFNTSSDSSAAPASQAEVTFLNLASQLNPIVFDTSILSDPRFTSLVDIHTSVVPEVTGRTDPFASIGG